MKREVKIGLFALLTLLVFYWGFNFLKGRDLFNKNNTYYTTYEQVNGLQVNSPITIKGFKVGTIRAMKYNPSKSERIVLELDVKSKYVIPSNSNARIYSDGLMGGKAMEIELGDSPVALQNEDTLHSVWDKDILEAAGSELEYIKAKANQLINEVMTTLGQVNAILRDNSANLATTMSNIAAISGDLEGVVRSEAADLRSIISNLNALSAALKNNAGNMDRIFTNVGSLTDSLAALKIPSAMEGLTANLDQLNTSLERLNQGKGTAGKVLNDEELYDELTAAASNLSLLLEDLKANPKRYVHFSLFGGGKDKAKKVTE